MRQISLKTELRQSLQLSPRLMQSMEVLQMNSQELLEYIRAKTEENPVLEQEEVPALRREYEALRQRASWIEGGACSAREEGTYGEQGAVDGKTESLEAFLRDQLDRQVLPRPLAALSRYIVEMVDEDGYLLQEDLNSLEELNIPSTLIQKAVETVQALEPAGVGARSLSECLLLQLARKKEVPAFVPELVTRFLPELGKKHYGRIAGELGTTVAELRRAETLIAGLEPRPGGAFRASEPAHYVRPDLFIVEEEGALRIVLNDFYLPKISVSPYYQRLLQESDQQETRDYLREKMRQAKWLMESLERRGGTLRRCAEAILEAQRPFFEGRSGELAPMNLSSLAAALQLHLSTVSRAMRGKYLQCRQGVFPLRYFFNRAVGEEGPSRQAVKQRLLKLVGEEDPCRPLSDQQLCTILSQEGIHLARRTVAQYRLELGIGASTARKHMGD